MGKPTTRDWDLSHWIISHHPDERKPFEAQVVYKFQVDNLPEYKWPEHREKNNFSNHIEALLWLEKELGYQLKPHRETE